MPLGRRLWRRVRDVVRRRRDEARMAEEMRQHLEHRIAQNVRQGMDRHEARHAAERAFGQVDPIKEELRDLRDPLGLESLRRDLSFSLRSLRRSPLLSLGAVLVVALCLGANVTAFSALYGLVLKPPAIPGAGQLVEVYNSSPNPNRLPKEVVSVAQYLDFKQHADLFEGFALSREEAFNLGTEESDPARIVGARTTPDYFDLLGVEPLLGRFYGESDQLPGQGNVIVLAQSLWESRYHADPHLIGKNIEVYGIPCQVIGVAPRSVENVNRLVLLFQPMSWNPALVQPAAYTSGTAVMTTLYARIKPGTSRSSALTQLNALERHFLDTVGTPHAREFVGQNQFAMALGTIRTEQNKSLGPALTLLQGGALIVLLLGCLNIAGLMLARFEARRAELAIRRALGAGLGTLTRQLLAENFLLVGGGTVLSLVIAWGGLRLVNRYVDVLAPRAPPISLDGVVLIATLTASLAVSLLVVMLPVIFLQRSRRHSPILGGAPNTRVDDGIFHVNQFLTIGHVALALLLLAGSGLLVRAFTRTAARDVTLDAAHLVHARIVFNQRAQDAGASGPVTAEILRRFREIPGVTAVSFVNVLPSSEYTFISLPFPEATLGPRETLAKAQLIGVAPDFFPTVGLRLIEGRNFTPADSLPGARRTLIVDRNFAERYFPGRSAVGQVEAIPDLRLKPENQPIVIGVVEPARFQRPTDHRDLTFVFLPVPSDIRFNAFSIVLRTSQPLPQLEPLLRNALRTVDPALPLYGLDTLQTLFDRTLDSQRGVTVFLGTLGLIALMLAAVGLSVGFACELSRRTAEIGIRRSLGASQREILASLLRQVFQRIALGLLLGLAAFLGARRWLGDQFFAPSPSDPSIYLLVFALLLLVTIGVIYWPARRASQIDPVTALRRE